MRVGYILLNPSDERQQEAVDKLNAIGCHRVFVDQYEKYECRPQWKLMLKGLKNNDEIVILQLSNVLKKLIHLAPLLELCRVKKIRIISLDDRFDSKDEMFTSSTQNFMDAIGTLHSDIISSRLEMSRLRAEKMRKESSAHESKKKRNQRCITLYNSGSSIDEIKETSGFTSKSSVFRILRENGVTLNRRKKK